jgi:hypothetical protein
MRELGPRVYVTQSFSWQGVGLWLIERRAIDGVPVTTVGQPVSLVYADLPEAAAAPETPTLNLSDDMARAMLDALSAHYGGHSDTRTLRRDYDDERKRVDRLTDAIIQVANR